MQRRLNLIALAVGSRMTRLSIRTLGFSRTVRLMGRVPRLGRQADSDMSLDALDANIRSVSGSPYGASCLDRSVLLWFLMRQKHLNGNVRIGVVIEDDKLQGHAWVEFNGTVVNDDADVAERFTVFEEDPVGIVFS
jgi:hypothetical protein